MRETEINSLQINDITNQPRHLEPKGNRQTIFIKRKLHAGCRDVVEILGLILLVQWGGDKEVGRETGKEREREEEIIIPDLLVGMEAQKG